MTTTVAIITEHNTVEIKEVSLNLKTMQKVVDGYIEFVYLNYDPTIVMVVNEKGKILDLPINAIATVLFQQHVPTFDVICGNALVVCPKDEKDYLDLLPLAMDWITHAVDTAVAANS